MPHTKLVELEVQLVAEDKLGPHAKVNVWVNSTHTVIRWGLDFYTYKFFEPVWAGLRDLGHPNARLILTKYDQAEPHAPQSVLQCLQDGLVVDEIYFRCSQLFLANLEWVTHSENTLGMADLRWNRLANHLVSADEERPVPQRRSAKLLLSATVGSVALVGLGAAVTYFSKASFLTQNAKQNVSTQLSTTALSSATDNSSGKAVLSRPTTTWG